MKKLFYLFIPLIAFGLFSCRKSSDNDTIQQYDDTQIQNYIKQYGLTGMKRDTSDADTTGIYYQVINPGTGSVVDYPSVISYTYQYRTFDGSYSTNDTILNHTNTYLGHVVPPAVQISIKNILKRKGGKIRLLIPSRLAFGRNGYFSGGVNINGNQCLDYSVTLIDDDLYINPTTQKPQINPTTNQYTTGQDIYDDQSIQKYFVANGLTGYTKTASGLYYKILTPGTGTDPISLSSTVGVNYTGYLFDGTVFDTETTTDGTAATTFTLYDVVDGFAEGLTHTTAGSVISMIIPSGLGYGNSANTSGATTIPAFSCLRFELTVISVAN